MKKLLFILLFFTNVSFGQITIGVCPNTILEKRCNLPSTGWITTPTLTANKLYIMFAHSDANNFYPTPGYTLGDSFEVVGRVKNSSGEISVWRFMPKINHSGENVGWVYGSPFVTNQFRGIYEISNVEIGANGANAIKQVVIDSATSSTSASITMAALGQRNAVMAFFSNDLNPFGGSVESGWSELYDDGCSTVDIGFYGMDRINTTDNTPSASISSSTWKGIAIEFRQSGRRITLIN